MPGVALHHAVSTYGCASPGMEARHQTGILPPRRSKAPLFWMLLLTKFLCAPSALALELWQVYVHGYPIMKNDGLRAAPAAGVRRRAGRL